MRALARRPLFTCAILAAACDSEDLDLADGFGCVVVGSQRVEADESTALGFSALDVLAVVHDADYSARWDPGSGIAESTWQLEFRAAEAALVDVRAHADGPALDWCRGRRLRVEVEGEAMGDDLTASLIGHLDARALESQEIGVHGQGPAELGADLRAIAEASVSSINEWGGSLREYRLHLDQRLDGMDMDVVAWIDQPDGGLLVVATGLDGTLVTVSQ